MKFTLKRDGLNFRRRRRKLEKPKVIKFVVLLCEIVAVIALSYFVSYSFGYRIEMNGDSMETNFSAGDKLLVNRLIYHVRTPKKGDIIVFYPSGNSFGNYSVKRVVGEPGDKVIIKDNILYINDTAYKTATIDDNIKDAGLYSTEGTVPRGQYFVIGDNINHSEDSRFSSIGTVKKSEILGKIWWNATFPRVGVVQ